MWVHYNSVNRMPENTKMNYRSQPLANRIFRRNFCRYSHEGYDHKRRSCSFSGAAPCCAAATYRFTRRVAAARNKVLLLSAFIATPPLLWDREVSTMRHSKKKTISRSLLSHQETVVPQEKVQTKYPMERRICQYG